MDSLRHDLRYAVRTLLKNRGFTAVAILTLALGIGATAAIFSVLDAVLLRPFPYPTMERLVMVTEITQQGQPMSVSWPNFQDWRDQNQVFEHLGIFRGATVNLTGGDRAERLNGSHMSSEMFKALGIEPMTGRAFVAEENLAGAPRVAIISERLWRNRFGADRSLVGQTITLNGEPHTVVGIMPAGMRFPSRLTDVWLPLGAIVAGFPRDRGAHPGLTALGTLKPGVTFDRAKAEMDTIAQRLAEQYPPSNKFARINIRLYYEQIVQNIRPALLVLVGAVAFVLLIGCANLANLMLAKTDGRQRELAIRAALGAGRRRIIQQLLIESLLLASAGGALGALLASWAVKAFVASRPTTVPRIDLVAVDGRVLLFVAVVSMLTGLTFGVLPALRASTPDLLTSLKEAVRSSSGAGARRFRSALVVVEVGLALMLLVGAGLMVRSFARLMAIDPGFTPERVVSLRVTLPAAKYPRREAWTVFHQELVRRVGALPAVDSAGINSAVPLEGGGSESEVLAEGQPMPSPDSPATMCLFQTASSDYFRAMGIALLKGRPFSDRDTADAVPVAIVDESLVQTFFPDTDPIGKRIAFEFRGHGPENPQPLWREIVGVVRHVRHYGMATEPPHVQVYTPYLQLPIYFADRRPTMALAVRTAIAPEALAESIRREVAAIDRDIPVYGLQTMSEYVAQNTEQPRLSVMLLSGFGALALILSVIGIYGVLSYTVSQRTHEIGIRMALGATRGDVLTLVVGQGMLLTMTGIAVGLAGSFAVSRWTAAMLFQVSPHDPATFAGLAALLAIVAFAAACIPGLRATRVNPIEALRYE